MANGAHRLYTLDPTRRRVSSLQLGGELKALRCAVRIDLHVHRWPTRRSLVHLGGDESGF